MANVCLRAIWWHVCYPLVYKRVTRKALMHTSTTLFALDLFNKTWPTVLRLGEHTAYGAAIAALASMIIEYIHVDE